MGADPAKFDPGSFRDACGAGGPLVLDVEHENPGQGGRWSLPQPFCVLGSGGRADVNLEGPEVDRRHLLLQAIGGQVFAVDLGTAAGTTWDGEHRTHGWVTPSTELGIGPYRIRVPSAPGGGLPVDPLSAGSRRVLDLPSIQWQIVVGEDPDAEPFLWKMGRALVLIGAHERAAMRLRGQGIAPFHAALVLTEGGVWAVDLVGQGSIRVNGVRVRCAKLDDGDILQIGSITFTPRYESGFQPQVRPEAAADDALHRVDAILTVWTNSLSGAMPGHTETVVSPESFISLTLSALQALRDCQRTQFDALRGEISALAAAASASPPQTTPTAAPAQPPPLLQPNVPPAALPQPPAAAAPAIPTLPPPAPIPVAPPAIPIAQPLAPLAPPITSDQIPGLPPLRPLFPSHAEDLDEFPGPMAVPHQAGRFPMPAPPPGLAGFPPPDRDDELPTYPLIPTGLPVRDEEEEEAEALGMLQRISNAQRERQSPLIRFLNKVMGDG